MLGQGPLVEQIVVAGVAPGYVPRGLGERSTQTVDDFDRIEVAEAITVGCIANDRA